MTPLISLLLPTHERPVDLRQTLDSLRATIADAAAVELLVYQAEGDVATEHVMTREILQSFWSQVRVLTGPHTGYRGLPRSINALAAASRGDWLFVFADDVVCDTARWDDVIRHHDHTSPALLTCQNNRGNSLWFPIISRPAYEAMGVVTLSQFHDEWLDRVFRRAAPHAVHRSIPAHFTDRIVHTDHLARLSAAEVRAFDLGILHAAERLGEAVEALTKGD